MITKTTKLDSQYMDLFEEIYEKSNHNIKVDTLEQFFGSIQEIAALDANTRRFQIAAIPEPTQEEINQRIQSQLTEVIQDVLDAKAKELNYDSCLSVCSYIDTGIQKFDDEGRAFRTWRSQVWALGYQILDEVTKGLRSIPTEQELIALLPELTIEYTVIESEPSSEVVEQEIEQPSQPEEQTC